MFEQCSKALLVHDQKGLYEIIMDYSTQRIGDYTVIIQKPGIPQQNPTSISWNDGSHCDSLLIDPAMWSPG